MEPKVESKKILVTSNIEYLNLDKLCATLVLAKLLAKQSHKVDVFISKTDFMKSVSEICSLTGINILEKLDADHFTISLQRNDVNVKFVKWEETNEKINLFVYTERGNLDTSNYTMVPGKPHYDEVYTIGVTKKSSLDKLLGDFKSVLTSATTINIDNRNDNEKFGQRNAMYFDAKSLAQAILLFAQENNMELSPVEATELLSAVYWKTNCLRNRFTTPLTLEHSKILMEKGANLSRVNQNIFATLSLIEAKAVQEIYANIKYHEGKFATSRVNRDTAAQLRNVQPINPDKNPLVQLANINCSFVLIPITEDATYVLASNVSGKVPLRKLFQQNNYIGDDLQSEFTLPGNVDQAEQTIIQKLNSGRSENKNRQQQPSNQPEITRDNRKPSNSNQPRNQEIQQSVKANPAPIQPSTPVVAPVIAAGTQIAAPENKPVNPGQAFNPNPIQPSVVVNIQPNLPTQPVTAEALPDDKQADPLAPAKETIKPDPAPPEEPPKPLFGGLFGGGNSSSSGGGGNPFGPI